MRASTATTTLFALLSTASLAAAPLAFAAAASAQVPDTIPDDPGTIQVAGMAEVRVPADQAEVSLAVETEGPTARQAAAENAERMDRVVSAVRATGIAGLEIETRGYTLRPRYVRHDRAEVPRIEGYTAVNHVVVTVDDPDAAGRLIDAGIEAGANRVASLSFSATRTDEARREALRGAVENARAEAEVVAEALGVVLGLPREVNVGFDRPSPRVFHETAMMEAADARAPTPVEPGEQTVTANVSIRYSIRAR